MRRVATSLAFALILSALLPTVGSAKDSAKGLYKKGVAAEARHEYVAAYRFYKQAYDMQPSNLKYQVPYERTRFLAAATLVHQGQKLREQDKLNEALALFQQAAEIDPSNDLAAQEIRRTQEMIQKQSGGGAKPPPSSSRRMERMEEDPLRKLLEEATGPAELVPLSNVPLAALEMTDDSKIIYETLGKLGNINVLFDPDYTSRRLTIRLQKVNLQEALNIVALESRTFWRPVTKNTIFVAQDTQAKRRELEQNVVKTFYLGNVSGPTDLQDIVNAIRTVLEVQRIQQIPSQSAIVVKGTPDQLAMAEKMIDDIDKPKPEVVVDVIVAQVRQDKLRNLGILPPQNATVALQSVGTTVSGSGTTAANLNFNDLQHLNSTNYIVTIDPVKAVALMSDTHSRILQSPRIRASDNEKAQLKVADKIPIATGSFGTPVGVGAAVGAVGVNTQFTYTDVGVILEITPRVHPDGQVTLKTVMEISNQNGFSVIGGIQQPIISTRRVEHTIRLKDGEMNLLGGILETQESKTASGTPFLGEIPLLKYIFSQQQKEVIHNEIVFLLVPHIVRGQELNDLNRRAFDVGTGSGIDLRLASAPTETAPPAPAASAPRNEAPAAAPAVRPPVTPRPVTPQPPPANRPQVPASPGVAQPRQPPASQPAAQSQTEAPGKPSPGGPVTLKLDPDSMTQQQGSTFSVNVLLTHGADVASVPIQISYDARVLQFVNVANGEFLGKDGQTVGLVHRDDPATGKLQVTAQRPPGVAGVSGNGTVFTLTFVARNKGTGTISISIPGAHNSKNQALETLGSQATVKVN